MNKPITDMTEVYAFLRKLTSERDKIAEKCEQLESENDHLKIELEETKAKLAKYDVPIKSSKNSSVPSSQNPINEKLKRTSSLRKKSDKKSGGQVGHKGVTIEMVQEADDTISCCADFCSCCGESLEDVDGEINAIRQVVDLPLPIKLKITNYVQVEKRCTCGCVTKGAFPKEAKAPVSYGSNIEATIAYLSTEQCIPFKRLTEILSLFFGLSISQGTVSNILERMRKQGKPAYELIRQRVEQSSVAGGDETGFKIGGVNHWMWTFQTELASFFFTHRSRGKIAVDEFFPGGLKKAILVSDRHSTYFNLDVENHQICIAHLLRNITYLSELNKEQTWSQRMLDLLRESIKLKDDAPVSEIDIDSIIDRMDRLLEEDLSNLELEFSQMQRGLIKRKEYLFTFLKHLSVPPDNNGSERAIRPVKTKTKVSGGFRTSDGADAYATLHSIVETAKKNKQNPFDALLAVARYQASL